MYNHREPLSSSSPVSFRTLTRVQSSRLCFRALALVIKRESRRDYFPRLHSRITRNTQAVSLLTTSTLVVSHVFAFHAPVNSLLLTSFSALRTFTRFLHTGGAAGETRELNGNRRQKSSPARDVVIDIAPGESLHFFPTPRRGAVAQLPASRVQVCAAMYRVSTWGEKLEERAKGRGARRGAGKKNRGRHPYAQSTGDQCTRQGAPLWRVPAPHRVCIFPHAA